MDAQLLEILEVAVKALVGALAVLALFVRSKVDVKKHNQDEPKDKLLTEERAKELFPSLEKLTTALKEIPCYNDKQACAATLEKDVRLMIDALRKDLEHISDMSASMNSMITRLYSAKIRATGPIPPSKR